MGKKNAIKEIVTDVIDYSTGEVISTCTEKTYTTNVQVDSFYMTFIEHIAPLFELKSDVAKNVLIYFCSLAQFDTNKVSFPLAEKNRLLAKLGISVSTLTKAIKNLKDLKLINGEKGEFMINPQIIWKGSTHTRRAIMKDSTLKVTFSIL